MDHHHTAPTPTQQHEDGHVACGRCIGRRTALMGMGAVGVAGLLAACGGGAPSSSGGGAPSATTEPTTEPSTDASAPSPEETTPSEEPATADPDAGGEALTTTADVPEGGGVVLHGPGVVVAQPAAGTFVAFSSTCTHQGCAVTTVADGLITCDCHGSQFNIADGSVVTGPATQPLPQVAIVVEGDRILAG